MNHCHHPTPHLTLMAPAAVAWPARWGSLASAALLSVGLAGVPLDSRAADHSAPAEHGKPASTAASKVPGKTASQASAAAVAVESPDLGVDLKKALKDKLIDKKSLTLVITDKPVARTPPAAATVNHSPAKPAAVAAAPAVAHPVAHPVAPAVVQRPADAHAPAVTNPRASRDYIKARAAALTGHAAVATIETHGNNPHGEVHWSYEGDTGPQAWGKLKPEFNVCAIGKRQSPINIEDSGTLLGPAEPLSFDYHPSSGTVVNNGHTIQVDLQGDNTLTVRSQSYRLVQFHFHSPSEEQVNFQHSAMVAHLVHKSADGQLAVVAVLLDPGVINPVINTVWTYMPLDVNDRVRLPAGSIDMNQLLPKDQRYYQFIGSLTTPPCTEGVLWMVLKQPAPISREQIRLFQKLYPNNARPVQAVNDRPVRNAQ